MIYELNGGQFRQMVIAAASQIENYRQQINDLNVFPVPDGDTGTNMSLTLGAGAQELASFASESIGKTADKVAGALLRGARGNSGVILSLLFRGIARSLKSYDVCSPLQFATAMQEGVKAAYGAVMKPAEGTILTVSRIASEAAIKCVAENTDFELLIETALEAARLALKETVNQNPVLKKANVVDAGGMGYCRVLEGMLRALRGENIEFSFSESAPSEKADFSDFDTEDIKFAYCTEVIIKIENSKDPLVLRDFASRLGDSLVMAADDEFIKLHVHVNDPGAIMTEAITYGSLEKVKVENMKLQHSGIVFSEASQTKTEGITSPAVNNDRKKYGVVAVSAGDGLTEIFKELGVDYIVTGGQTMNPSTQDILTGIEAANAETVFVLPNNKNIIMAAQQCAELCDNQIIVLETKSVPQGISAMLNFDASLDAKELTCVLNDSFKDVVTAQITYAARDSDFDGHTISANEYLCLLEGKLIENSNSIEDVISSLNHKLTDMSPNYLTVYYGCDTDEDSAQQLADRLCSGLNDTTVSVLPGGQPVYYYLIAIE